MIIDMNSSRKTMMVMLTIYRPNRNNKNRLNIIIKSILKQKKNNLIIVALEELEQKYHSNVFLLANYLVNNCPYLQVPVIL